MFKHIIILGQHLIKNKDGIFHFLLYNKLLNSKVVKNHILNRGMTYDNGRIYLGRDQWYPPVPGKMKEIRMYEYFLNASDIKAIYD